MKNGDSSTFKISYLHKEVTIDGSKTLKVTCSRNVLELLNLSMNLEGQFAQGQIEGKLPTAVIVPNNPKMIYLHLT